MKENSEEKLLRNSQIKVYKLLLIYLICFLSCSGTKTTKDTVTSDVLQATTKPKYEQIAMDKFTGDKLFLPNQNNTYVLCVNHNKPTIENPIPSFSYFIFDLNSEEIIYEDSHENGNVNWKNNEQIIIHTFPGQIKYENDKPIVYIYDIKKNKKFIDEIIEDK